MKFSYTPQGTCSKQIEIEIEDDTIKQVIFTGGCNGNTQGVASLLRGMKNKRGNLSSGRYNVQRQRHKLSRPIGQGPKTNPSGKIGNI